jgi:hypothetical protein
MNEETPKYPSATDQAKNLTKVTGKILSQVLAGDKVMAPEEIQRARIQTCHSCDKYDRNQKRCYECGCFVEIKSKFALEGCPLGKWLDVDGEWFEETYVDAVKDIVNYDEDDIPTPPDNPQNGDVYIHRGKKWKFHNDLWEFVIE